jgi:hypothetical protein
MASGGLACRPVAAAMTLDLYGHMIDANLWQAARLVGDISGTFEPFEVAVEDEDD